MSVIYLLSEKTTARKSGGRMVVMREGEERCSLPILKISCVVVGQRAQMTTQCLFALMKERVPVVYVDGRGRILGILADSGESLKRLTWQLSFAEDEAKALSLAKEIVAEKMKAQSRLLRYYGKSRKTEKLEESARRIDGYGQAIAAVPDADELRGLEGRAAAAYFDAFPYLLTGEDWTFPGRVQHPAHDPVNALLNYGYAFLEREVRLALAAVRLDPRIGLLHANNGRKDSLVYDMMEPFRQPVIDRLVLKLCNLHILACGDFSCGEDGCRLAPEGRKTWIARYEAYMEQPRKRLGGVSPRSYIRKGVMRIEKRMREIDGEPEERMENADLFS